MTKQEELFFDRVALKMSTDSTLSVEVAAKMVCADDARILNAYARLSDAKQSEFKRIWCNHVYAAIRYPEGEHAEGTQP